MASAFVGSIVDIAAYVKQRQNSIEQHEGIAMSYNKNKLAKAVTTALAGTILSVGAVSAEAHTMYNTFTTTDPSETDGWVYGGVGNPSYPVASPGWVGTESPTTLPFGYAGKAHLNWAAELHNAGDSLEISSADALARYGVTVEIDTGAGAWQDASATPTGWKHQTDIGLIMAHETMWVTLNPSVVTGTGYDIQNFGITVFTGMDTNTGSYSHHGAWNCPECATPRPYEADNPFGTVGLTYLTHDGTVDAVNGLTFLAEAGQVYSIYLGGAGVGHWGSNIAEYRLLISTAPVPIPAAVWLFGSALAGIVTIGYRRKNGTPSLA
ncbi:conserved protein of unknown function [Methylocaldum szegediense]|uniref:VPLPA-CTERM sorting domain-containing protein n=2 Tax=Methylocaldum szegediense TaxID=73780 RepID=A0ABM9HZ86_9GAMM|nr:conserved protein of unknown function [Methylocaldum szegediense]